MQGQVLTLLVDDGVDGDCRLPRGTVPDDELPLASADGYHGVQGYDPGLDRRIHGLTGDNVWGYSLNGPGAAGLDRALAIQGSPQWVHHAADEPFPHRDFR